MDEGRLDEQVAHDGLVVEETVQPLDVGPHSVPDRLPEKTHPAAQHVHPRVALQPGDLQREPIPVGQVVRVHARHERSPRGREGGVEGGHQAPGRRAEDDQARVGPGTLLEQRPAPVAGAVVDRDDLDLREGLAEHRLEAGAQGGGGVPHGQEDGDPGHGQAAGKWTQPFFCTKSRAARRAASSDGPSTT